MWQLGLVDCPHKKIHSLRSSKASLRCGDSDCARNTGPVPLQWSLDVTIVESVGRNDTAMLQGNEGAATSGHCRVRYAASKVVTDATCQNMLTGQGTENRGTASSSASVKFHSAASLQRLEYSVTDSTVGQCRLLSAAAAQAVKDPTQLAVVFAGCNHIGGTRLSERALQSIPKDSLDLRASTCGLSATMSMTESYTEDLIQQRVVPLRGLTPSLSQFVGAALVATTMTQYGNGIAVLRSVAVMRLASHCQQEGDEEEEEKDEARAGPLNEPLDLGSSPLQLQWGAEAGQYLRGAVVGNMILSAAVAIVGAALVGVDALQQTSQRGRSVSRRREGLSLRNRLWQSAASTGMPTALVMPVWGVLLPSTVTASVSLFFTAQRSDMVLGVAGVLWAIGAIGWMVRRVGVRPNAFPSRAVKTRSRRRRHRSPLQLFAGALLGRTWLWQDRPPTTTRRPSLRAVPSGGSFGFTRVFGPLFDSARKDAHWWASCEFAVGLFCAALCGLILTEPRAACQSVVLTVGVVSAAVAAAVLLVRPFDALLETLLSFTGSALAAITAFVSATADSEDTAQAILWAQLILTLGSLAVTIVCVVVEVLESGTTTHRGCKFLLQWFAWCRAAWRRRSSQDDDEADGSDKDSPSDRSEDDDDRSDSGDVVHQRQRKRPQQSVLIPPSPATAAAAGPTPDQAQQLARLVKMICHTHRKQSLNPAAGPQ